MPELPEVEVIVRGLRRNILGEKVTAVPLLKPHVLANTAPSVLKSSITNRFIEKIGRIGKYIILRLTGNMILVSHLRMTGQLKIAPLDTQPNKHTAFIIQLTHSSLIFDDIRKFGRLWLTDDLKKLSCLEKLGPDALTITIDELRDACKSKRPIKNLLLDQVHIAGIGNIYASEILCLAKIHPLTPANKLDDKEIKRIHENIKPTLELAIENGGTSISDYVNSNGVPGEFQKILKVYGRQDKACPVCSAKIQRLKMANRSTYLCPKCQKSKK